MASRISRVAKSSQAAAAKRPRRHIKVEAEQSTEDNTPTDIMATSPVTAPKSGKKKTLDVPREPENWREHLANIRKMRQHRDAPVDSMGCQKICDATEKPEVW